MKRVSLLVFVLAALPAVAAAAVPAVPGFVQGLIAKRAAGAAYVPTRLPFRYRYTSYRASAGRVVLRFDDARYARNGRHAITFTSAPFGDPLTACGDGRVKTLQLDGNKVYWDGTDAWRCLRRGSRAVRVSARGPNLPDVALGRVIASVRHVA